MIDLDQRLIAPGDLAVCYLPRIWRRSPYRVAMVIDEQDGGERLWIESQSVSYRPCYITGNLYTAGFAGLKLTAALRDAVRQGGRVEILSPTDIRDYTGDELARLRELLIEQAVWNNLRSDQRSAMISDVTIRGRRPSDRERLFTSELIAEVLTVLGRLNNHTAGRRSPAWLVKTLIRTGVYQFSHAYTPADAEALA